MLCRKEENSLNTSSYLPFNFPHQFFTIETFSAQPAIQQSNGTEFNRAKLEWIIQSAKLYISMASTVFNPKFCPIQIQSSPQSSNGTLNPRFYTHVLLN